MSDMLLLLEYILGSGEATPAQRPGDLGQRYTTNKKHLLKKRAVFTVTML